MSTTTPRCSSRTRRATGSPRWSARPSPMTVRDTRFLPSEGYLLQLDQDVAGLGGDNRFLRHEGEADWYYSLPQGLGAQPRRPPAATSTAIGGEDVHLANRFFLGGATLRGFAVWRRRPARHRHRRLAGRQSLLYRHGRAALSAGPAGRAAHLRADLRRCRHARPTSTSTARRSRTAHALRVGAGFGFSWLSPLGPLAVDIAQAIVKEDERQDRDLPRVVRHPLLSSRSEIEHVRGLPGASACPRDRALAWRDRPRRPVQAQEKLPPAVAAVIDYTGSCAKSKAGQEHPRPDRGPAQGLPGPDRQRRASVS